ncbi:MAG: DUF3106 domain-containing protein [Acidobacteria bacterium]|nr:DUF3106 domain-containing protein [Acidobacteriota bacterium]
MTLRMIYNAIAIAVLGVSLVVSLGAPLFAAQPKSQTELPTAEDLTLSYYFSDQQSDQAEPLWMAFWQAGPPDTRAGERRGGGQREPRGPAGRLNNRPDARPPLPPRMLERLRNMKPADRERVLENNRRFQELTPERQAELRERLRMLLEMPLDQRRALDRRLSVFRNMRPEQQRKAREIYEKHWRVLSPQRRMAVLEEFRSLRDMSPEVRGKRMTSEEYQSQFNSEERTVLDELSAL